MGFQSRVETKLEPRWEVGVFPVRTMSSKKIVPASQGTFVAQSIKRKPEDHTRGMDLVKNCKGLPQSPQRDGSVSSLSAPSEDDPSEPRPVSRTDEEAWRRMCIKQQDLDKRGYAAGCPECVGIREGKREGKIELRGEESGRLHASVSRAVNKGS